MFKMFVHYDKKDKFKLIAAKIFTFVFIGLMTFLAMRFSKVEVPELKNQVSLGLGFILIMIIAVLAIFNRINILFKIKSIAFLIIFLILLFFRSTIETLTIATGLITIPLLVDDLIINNYFKYLNIKKYWNFYKFVSERDA